MRRPAAGPPDVVSRTWVVSRPACWPELILYLPPVRGAPVRRLVDKSRCVLAKWRADLKHFQSKHKAMVDSPAQFRASDLRLPLSWAGVSRLPTVYAVWRREPVPAQTAAPPGASGMWLA